MRRRRRKAFAVEYFERDLKRARQWVPLRTEEDNFYYDLTDRNSRELGSLMAAITGVDVATIDGYLRELADDTALRAHLTAHLLADPRLRDARIAYGRRAGWYALVRALRPRLVVETGVHHGVGACVLTAALLRNADEGHGGRYVGTDIDPRAGFLLRGEYASVGQVLFGDSLESLATIDEPIDLFINDSDHSSEYEAREYRAIAGKLSAGGLILGDNSHATSALLDFARAHGRPYLLFREEPLDHWYPGAGIGISPASLPTTAPVR